MRWAILSLPPVASYHFSVDRDDNLFLQNFTYETIARQGLSLCSQLLTLKAGLPGVT
jgi:hypothetical protein